MKNLLYAIFAAVGLMTATSCSDFGDTNVDPEHLNEGNLKYEMLFTNSQHQALGSDWDVWRNGIIYGSTMMQHTTSCNWKHVFYVWDDGYNAAAWDAWYSGNRGCARDIKILERKWKEEPGREADYQMARIVKSYIFHRLTDLYGDLPYSEAGAGIDYPKYDTQAEVYADLLKELDEAQAALAGATSTLNEADIYFGGNTEKWRKFANSLILRIAMRMSKVDPASAEKWVKIAVTNGLIESAEDNAMLQHQEGNVNDDSAEPYAKIFVQSDPGKFFLTDFFVNMLKDSNDPRLPLISVVCTTDPTLPSTDKGYDHGNADPSIQVGMPVGYDDAGGQWDISTAPGYPGENFKQYYSTINRYTYGDPNAPTMIVTYAENQLLLAEAAYRGWLSGTNATKSAKEYYEEGVRAAMKQFSVYPSGKTLYNEYLTDEAIEKYLAENPFDQSKALEQINTQYYIATFCDEYETFANWRRSGYPVLTPVNKGYPNSATNGTIPRRFTYPTTESQVNSAHYQEAVSRLNNGDAMTSRVWWDKE